MSVTLTAAATTGTISIIITTCKSIKAFIDNREAKKYTRLADDIISAAKSNVGRARRACNESLKALGNQKLHVLDGSVARFVKSFEKIKNIDFETSDGMYELEQFRIDKQTVCELKKMSGYAASILGGAAAGTLGGALAAFGAYSAVITLGKASTGTAIILLKGAALKSATLAFLGGGSLAAGGLGMAGGVVVLGGLVAGPALAIMGFIVGANASKNLDNAKSNYAQAQVIALQLQTAAIMCKGIRKRSAMFLQLLERLNTILCPLVSDMEKIIAKNGKDWNSFNDNDKHTIISAAAAAQAIKMILDTPILTENGKLVPASRAVADEVKTVVENLEDIKRSNYD